MADGACMPLPEAVGWAARGALLWTCAAVLVVKKVSETHFGRRQRTWKNWALDSSKQCIGAAWFALLGSASPPFLACDSFLGAVLAETTIGLPIKFVMLVTLMRLFERGSGNPGVFRTGEYIIVGNHVWEAYILQLVLWLSIMTVFNFITPCLMPPFVALASIVLWFFAWYPSLQLVMALIIFPCVLYGMQVWVTDDFLKREGTDTPGLAWSIASKYLPASFVQLTDRLLCDEVKEDTRDYVPPRSAAGSYQAPPRSTVDSVPGEVAKVGRDLEAAQPAPASTPKRSTDHGKGVGDLEDRGGKPPPQGNAVSLPPPLPPPKSSPPICRDGTPSKAPNQNMAVGDIVAIGSGRHGGRQGIIDKNDASTTPFRVVFDDRQSPTEEWFKKQDVVKIVFGAPTPGGLPQGAVLNLFADTAEAATPNVAVGDIVEIESGRHGGRQGKIDKYDASSTPFKVVFDDGQSPTSEWFKKQAVKLLFEGRDDVQTPKPQVEAGAQAQTQEDELWAKLQAEGRAKAQMDEQEQKLQVEARAKATPPPSPSSVQFGPRILQAAAPSPPSPSGVQFGPRILQVAGAQKAAAPGSPSAQVRARSRMASSPAGVSDDGSISALASMPPITSSQDARELRNMLAEREELLKSWKQEMDRVLAVEEATTRQLSEHIQQHGDDPEVAALDPSTL